MQVHVGSFVRFPYFCVIILLLWVEKLQSKGEETVWKGFCILIRELIHPYESVSISLCNILYFNISKIDICPFRAYQRSFRLFQGDFSKDIHQRSRLLCFTQNDHTGHAGFKICPFLKWAQLFVFQ